MKDVYTKQDYNRDLQACYSQQAEHFFHTRKKHRPEVGLLCDSIAQYKDQFADDYSVSVLDIGCGAGRLSEHIAQAVSPIRYTGIDNAQGMIDVATREYTNGTFICADMLDYCAALQQESKDIIVGLASIQHIKGFSLQQQLFFSLYRGLKRGGKVILVNRSFSHWFIKQYRSDCLSALIRSRVKSGRKRNDLLIPRKDRDYAQTKKIYKRMYHIYTLKELESLAQLSGFIIEKSGYVLQDGTFSSSPYAWMRSRNSVIILRKGVFE